jgi:hypothetical protein
LDCGKNAFEITKNVVIPESEHSESFVDQATIADHVCSGLVVLSAVNFNNDKSFPADEIADVTAHGLLSNKFMPFDLPVANAIPENSFRIRLIGAQLSRDSDHLPIWSTHCHAPHPETPLRAVSDLSPQKGGERLKRSHPTNPFIAFTGALSGNTVSASTRSARPR